LMGVLSSQMLAFQGLTAGTAAPAWPRRSARSGSRRRRHWRTPPGARPARCTAGGREGSAIPGSSPAGLPCPGSRSPRR